ncbi:MAG: HD domain-containing protein [Candidatus Eisenbacteria bacterium]|uniref:HD domain-containing protein n=1 Tax=Eiseniibacteriota bacterium TaxID=2212470 RepID=A0A948S1F3_UNCEI|nr:HD domain-containing protein [Candidatus Eisenbacteria bacterium]MBU1950746.1 HD domain-containing protein [Candidatus Eisenbacteria bacterium]MBU2693117.1 HD domain-containing protein [Candidatus Eisenbacteria bacterium]
MNSESYGMTSRILRAVQVAVEAHSGQNRKASEVPYVLHPLAVAAKLVALGSAEDMIIAGILHDTVEDTDLTSEMIKREFGPEVMRIVEGCSEPDKSDTWENRKRHTLEMLKTAPDDVLIVSWADKLDNIRSIRDDMARCHESIWKRFRRPRESQEWLFRSLLQVFEDRMKNSPLDELVEEFRVEVERVFGPQK